jgi:osmotically-inducible protein OsmY
MPTMTRRHDAKQNDLARRVRNFLHKQSQDLHSLEVEADQDVIVVRGRVQTSSARQLAADCCQRVAGVRRVVNETTVAN